MAYGQSLDEVDTRKSPKKTETDYGYTINITNQPEFGLKQFFIKKEQTLNLNEPVEYVLFIEEGNIKLNSENLMKGSVIKVPKDNEIEIKALEDSIIYYFTGNKDSQNNIKELKITKTTNSMDKYWGKIETIESNSNFSAKRLELQQEKPGSLEYHQQKKEAYFVHEGKVRVGVRIGRAENKNLVLEKGQIFLINQGTMHCRYGIEPSVIIEVGTKDDDSDSHLVEDGSKGYMHEEIQNT